MDKPVPACSFFLLLLIFSLSPPVLLAHYSREQVEEALSIVNDIASDNMGPLCVSQAFRMLPTPVETDRYDVIRQKADMAALLLEQVGVTHHSGVAQAVSRSLVASDAEVVESRVVGVNATTGLVESSAVWRKVRGDSRVPRLDEVSDKPPPGVPGYSPPGDPHPAPAELPPGIELPPEVPWYPEGGQFAPHVAPAARGLWTYPYYSCQAKSWLLSYTVTIPNSSNQLLKGFLSFDIDISRLEVNQCDASLNPRQIKAFLGSHKCHNTTQCTFHRKEMNWRRGSYSCECRDGFYLSKAHSVAFDGNIMEVAWGENGANGSTPWVETPFHCLACAPGCLTCTDSTPCLATYNWPFRLTLLTVSAVCVFLTLCMIAFVFHHRRLKVFKVASPIFLSITLLGCAIMYLEMAAIFPILDIYSCIATKWSRHLGFCITYTALLMKTWRVSLTYRVKSAHKVKLTDKQLLQWMFPILLVMLIYLGTWTLSDPPHGEPIKDNNALIFKQCSFNWWDHSLAIGEVLFLAWGIRVCYSVRHAESLFNEARLISYAIYNIAIVNIAMVAFHLFLFPRAGPDIKYMLGFIRTQLSTSVTIALVFGPKVVRVIRGQGDQWDTKARTRAVTASFSLNGVGLVTEHTPDLYQENEELKEEIQKLAGQIEFMKIVNMELNNRHLKPRAGGYFSSGVPVQSPRTTAGAGPSTEVSERV